MTAPLHIGHRVGKRGGAEVSAMCQKCRRRWGGAQAKETTAFIVVCLRSFPELPAHSRRLTKVTGASRVPAPASFGIEVQIQRRNANGVSD